MSGRTSLCGGGMSEDIVERLRRWVDREIAESDPAGAITAAADEIVRRLLP